MTASVFWRLWVGPAGFLGPQSETFALGDRLCVKWSWLWVCSRSSRQRRRGICLTGVGVGHVPFVLGLRGFGGLRCLEFGKRRALASRGTGCPVTTLAGCGSPLSSGTGRLPWASGLLCGFPLRASPCLFPSRPCDLPCVPVDDSVHPVPVRGKPCRLPGRARSSSSIGRSL